MSGDDRRPKLDFQIPTLGWQRVGMENIFRAGNRSDIFKLEMRHNKHFKVECIFLRERWSWWKSRNEVLFWLNLCTASPPMKAEHLQLSSMLKLSASVLNPSTCRCMFKLPLCIFQLWLPLLNYQAFKWENNKELWWSYNAQWQLTWKCLVRIH